MQSNRQSGNYKCGYYVMQWMLTILQSAINKGWDQVIPQYNNTLKFGVYYSWTNSKKFQMSQLFNDQHPLDSEALEYVRTTWSKYFLTKYNTLRIIRLTYSFIY